MNKREFICIVCPNGCEMEVEYADGKIIRVDGNKCKRGISYVEQEMLDPKRTISSSVRIANSDLPLCSVRLTKPIPKKQIFAVMKEIDRIDLEAPVKIGDIVIKNVCGLDSDVIITKNMEKITD